MAIAGSKVTVTHKLTWTPATGQSITFSGSESFVQVGLQAFAQTINVLTTTTTLPIGGATGSKYFGVQNTDPSITIYVDSVTPVVPSAVSAHTLPAGKSMLIFTCVDTWYAIAASGNPEAFITACQP